jgi:hypothetical protein
VPLTACLHALAVLSTALVTTPVVPHFHISYYCSKLLNVFSFPSAIVSATIAQPEFVPGFPISTTAKFIALRGA